MTTPAYVGGEPLKAYLLKQYNVPITEGAASVVIAKTTMTIAQVVFILVGIPLGFWILGAGSSAGQTITAGLVSVGVLVCSIVWFVLIQRGGLFASILSIVNTVGVRIRALDAQEERLRSIDHTIRHFYSHHQGVFCASTVIYFFGWMAEALEVFAIIYGRCSRSAGSSGSDRGSSTNGSGRSSAIRGRTAEADGRTPTETEPGPARAVLMYLDVALNLRLPRQDRRCQH